MAFPGTALDVRLAFAFGASLTGAPSSWVWTDCTSDLRAGTSDGVAIKVGRSDRASSAEPNNAGFSLNNFNGQYSVDNPSGVNYPNIVENVPGIVAVAWNLNPTFETNVSDWAATGCALTRSTTRAKAGSASMLITPTGGTLATATVSTLVPVRPYGGVFVDAWVYSVAGYAGSGGVRVAVDWYDISSVLISTSTGTSTVIAAGAWTYLAGMFGTAPSNAAYCVGEIQILGTPANTDLLWVDEARTSLPRICGFVDGWTPAFDETSNLPTVQVSLSGPRRRKGQGSPPSESAIGRTLGHGVAPSIYMPLEDGALTTLPTVITNGEVIGVPTIEGTIKFGSFSTNLPPGTNALADFSAGGLIYGTLTRLLGTGSVTFSVEIAFASPSAAPASDIALVYVNVSNGFLAGGTILGLNHTTPGIFAGTTVSYAKPSMFDGLMHTMRYTVDYPGTGNATYTLYLDDVVVNTTTGSALGLGYPTAYVLNPGAKVGYSGSATGLGHFRYIHSVVTVGSVGQGDTYNALQGYPGETAAARITRVMTEESESLTTILSPTLSMAMGAQSPGTLLDILDTCEKADGGILYEPRDFFGFGYVVRSGLYDQAVALTLDRSAGQIDNPFSPVHDDALRANDVTLTRTNGGSVEYVGDTSHGLYTVSDTVNVQSDSLLTNIAAWRVNLGTQRRSLRYPQLNVEFANSATVALLPTWLAMRGIGARIQATHPVSQMAPDTIDLLVSGYTETIGLYGWAVAFLASPYDPWRVQKVADAQLGRLTTGGSTLAAGVNSSATSLSVQTNVGKLWTTTATFPNDFPFDLNLAGERITVTGIVGTSSPQTFTVTRSTNGVAKAQVSGAVVNLWQPGVIAL